MQTFIYFIRAELLQIHGMLNGLLFRVLQVPYSEDGSPTEPRLGRSQFGNWWNHHPTRSAPIGHDPPRSRGSTKSRGQEWKLILFNS